MQNFTFKHKGTNAELKVPLYLMYSPFNFFNISLCNRFLYYQGNQSAQGTAATSQAKTEEKEKDEIDEKQENEEPLDNFTNSVVTGMCFSKEN